MGKTKNRVRINRRTSIKKLVAATGTVVVLPLWANAWSIDGMAVNTTFSKFDQELLTLVVDTIIPAGDSIGAVSVGVDKFLQRLFDDCYELEVQDRIKAQLNEMNNSAQLVHGKRFNQCDVLQRVKILGQFANSGDPQTTDTFKLIKSETIRGFSTSKEVMTKYLNYQVIPGHFYGCIEVNTP